MIYNIKYTSKFKKDLKLAKKQNKDLNNCIMSLTNSLKVEPWT